MNEHAPEFIPRSAEYEQSIPEDTLPGTTVQTVLATDADSPTRPNGMVTYRITSGSLGKFEMEATSGLVTVAPQATFDFDVQKLYNMTVSGFIDSQKKRCALQKLFAVEVKCIRTKLQYITVLLNAVNVVHFYIILYATV